MNGFSSDGDADRIRAMARAFQDSRILLTAFELGVFTALSDGPAASSAVACAVKADARAVDRLLCALCALGFARKKDGLYANAPAATRYLAKSSPEYMAELGHMSDLFASWAGLTRTVRAGAPAVVRGFEDQDAARAENFLAAMHNVSRSQAPVLAEALDLSGAKRLLDVGGGSGVFSIALANKNPGLTCTVFDVVSAVPIARRHAAQAGLGDRVKAVAGDYMRDGLGEGFDAALFSSIIHINGPRENAWLMKKAFDALSPGGQVIVRDFIMDEDRTSPARGAIFALNMLLNTNRGDTYPESEVAGWLLEAGFTDPVRLDLGPGVAALVARKPGAQAPAPKESV